MTRRLAGFALALGVLTALLASSPVASQTVYTWTDRSGTVHFADSAPPDVKQVEERNMPAARPITSEATAEGTPQTDAGATPTVLSGPARLVVISNRSSRTGPSSMHVNGVVKNVGGAPANGVQVAIAAVDAAQGNPCLTSQASVEPSTLNPGDVGMFDTDIDSPCLLGDAPIDLTPLGQ